MNIDVQNSVASQKKKNCTGQSIAAYTAGSLASAATLPASFGVLYGVKKIGNLPADQVELIKDGTKKVLDYTGLAKKGVEVWYLAKKKINLAELMVNPKSQIAAGINAVFAPIINKILMPEKDISFAVFHEMGHAHNFNFSKIGKILQKMRMPGMTAAGLIMLYGAFSKKSKPEEGKELTKGQKVKNFVRDNAGKLSFAAMVPMLAEEMMATIKGQGFANKVLPKNLAKNVFKGNAIAYLSSLISAVGLGLASMTAVKVKNHLVAKKENKADN